MEEIFIKSIHINKVRHLENVEIPISETERKHLILTGKNGSGKTSVLLEIKNIFKLINDNKFAEIEEWKLGINHHKKIISKAEFQLSTNNFDEFGVKDNERKIRSSISRINTFASKLKKLNLDLDYSNLTIKEQFDNGNFILTHFDAKRNLKINVPKGINKIELKDKYTIDENVSKDFLQHIVNLKADRSFARDENDETSVNQIDSWFKNFEQSLQNIFNDDKLKLEFDRKNYNFTLINKDGESSDFTTLSDGYSTILNIISELIMRMENKASKSYDIQGIVLIDEIETHLHIDLQKKILPFLTNFFPKIQFIVTTHSPFVLNSVSNTVIFDLEKKLLVEDMTGYSVNAIVESYFDSDDYSMVVKEKMTRYESLSERDNLSEEEEDELFELKEYFEDLPKMFSPELALKINQIQLANLSVK